MVITDYCDTNDLKYENWVAWNSFFLMLQALFGKCFLFPIRNIHLFLLYSVIKITDLYIQVDKCKHLFLLFLLSNYILEKSNNYIYCQVVDYNEYRSNLKINTEIKLTSTISFALSLIDG